MALSLPDQYVLLLQDVVEENRLLREQMKETIEAGQSTLAALDKKVDNLTAVSRTSGRRVRQTGRPIRVPRICSNNVRRKLKSLLASDDNLTFRFNESVDSEHNSLLFRKMVEEIHHEYGGDDKSPWSTVVLKEAFKTYYKSSKATSIRKRKGTHAKHVQDCRRRNRKDEKLAKRLQSLKKMSWDVSTVAKISEVLTQNYMSSEESETDENPPHRIKHYSVHGLPWQSRQFRTAKRKLDKVHNDSLPGLVNRLKIPRVIGVPSARAKPNDCPRWACRSGNDENEAPASLNSSMESSSSTSPN